MEKLKRENRRQDELITLKEDKIAKLEGRIEKLLKAHKKASDEES